MTGSALRNLHELDRYRITSGPLIEHWRGDVGDELCGAFQIPTRSSQRGLSTATTGSYKIRVIVSGLEGWDHVSVSLQHRTPSWEEMEFIKRLFFKPEAVCYQLHVAEAEHLSAHPYCLHIWRCHNIDVPLPPPIFVAPPRVP